MYEAYASATTFSNAMLQQLRNKLAPIVPSDCIAVTFGSYARREASAESDIDYLILTPDAQPLAGPTMQAIYDEIAAIVKIDPSAGGPFAQSTEPGELLKNIGGKNESNKTFTHRLLYLLEGEWLTNSDQFSRLRLQLIERYVLATKRDHQLALFLLNDVIRFWRTMTVDYMYKTTEDTKPWGIKNVKLVFSRKLMYSSGLFSVAQTVDRAEAAKVELLETLFNMPVIDRMIEICGEARMSNALKSYDLFLKRLESATVREQLKRIDVGDHADPVFRELKNEGHHFTRELVGIFERTFHKTHPIHRAVIL